jgi:hypothetical protein
MIFTSPDSQKEWDELTEIQKGFVMNNLASMADKMEAKIAIEMLCHVINDLVKRIEDLENARN